MSTNVTTELEGTATTTITGPHLEPEEHGGETFHRCTDCGRESIAGPENILHRDGCQNA